MRISGDRSGININELSKRESWALISAVERELKFATEYKDNVGSSKNLELHIEILEKLLSGLNKERNEW